MNAADESFLRQAIQLAREARANRERPFGAVLVADGQIVAQGGDQCRVLCDPTAHAEVLAIGAAAAAAGDWRLAGATCYVTLEPCTMCCGALLLCRIARVVYGAHDPRAGAVVSVARLFDGNPYRHQVEVIGGIAAAACAELLKVFFAGRRDG